ncbi:hypothetical protein OHB00_40655 [Streptomyces sp. NBC_00631]|uniref:hypothetical protein n=1 Tax=Streptomyces sp. NBC_00631 TaxID=2975793 RepID=UPI0030E48B0E
MSLWFGRRRRGGHDSDAQAEEEAGPTAEEEAGPTAEEEALPTPGEGHGARVEEEADDPDGDPDDSMTARGSRPRVNVKVAGTAALLGAALLTTPFLLTQSGDADHTARNAAGARPDDAVGQDGLASPGIPTTPTVPERPSAPSGKATASHPSAKAAEDAAKKFVEESPKHYPPGETDKTGHEATATHAAAAKSSKPTSKSTTKSTTKPTATAVPTSLNIPAGQSLGQGQSWKTDRLTVTMQTDGNFVVYNAAHKGLWSTRTNGYGYRAKMNSDGNFVIYDKAGNDIWDTGTSGHSGAYFRLGHDGNVMVVYQGHAIWNAGTRVV